MSWSSGCGCSARGVRETLDERGLLLSGVPGEAADKDLALESQNALRLGPNEQGGGRFAGIPCLWESIMSSQTSDSKPVSIHESPIAYHWKEVPGRAESAGSYDWRSRGCEKEGESGREGKSLLSAELLLAIFLLTGLDSFTSGAKARGSETMRMCPLETPHPLST